MEAVDANEFVDSLQECSMKSSAVTATNTIFIANAVFILVAIKVCHFFIGGFLRQPRIITEFIIGLILGNMPSLVHATLEQAFVKMDTVTASTYMFVLGLEMDPSTILERPGPEATLAYTTVATTCIICSLSYAIFNQKPTGGIEFRHPIPVLVGFVFVVSATSSSIVTRMTTDLKLSNSEIGKRAIRAGLFNDMICTMAYSFTMIFSFKGWLMRHESSRALKALEILTYLVIELCFIGKVGRIFLRHMNRRNPEGMPIRGMDMIAIVAFTQALCYWPYLIGYDTRMNAFLVGLFLPREGRVSNFIISKINYALTSFVLPLYLSMAGIKTNKSMFTKEEKSVTYWRRLSGITTLTTLGKLIGALLAGRFQGLHWLEAITLGLLLNVKGYLVIFFTYYTKERGLGTDTTVMVMHINVMMSIVFVPPVVALIVRYVRLKSGKPRTMGLQWQNPESTLRMTVGIHGPHNLPAFINLIEMMTCAAIALDVYVMDMIELTPKVEATLVFGHGEGVIVKEETVVVMRQEIEAILNAYLDECASDGLQIKRSLVVSSVNDMHDDICCSTQDSLAMIVILPFHRKQRVDGTMEDVKLGFRTVNRNVLQHSTCSVGILVSRNFGQGRKVSSLAATKNVAVIFIGGADDREALAYAGFISRHPCVCLTVIRFLVAKEAVAMARGHGQRIFDAMNNREVEMKTDDEYFAGFYDHFVVGRNVGYMEKSVASGAEVVATLRDVQGDYELFVVGRGAKRDSILTSGMSQWAEYPELGPIGDILAHSDFSVSASVLVIQQRDHSRDPKYISDEFMPL